MFHKEQMFLLSTNYPHKRDSNILMKNRDCLNKSQFENSKIIRMQI